MSHSMKHLCHSRRNNETPIEALNPNRGRAPSNLKMAYRIISFRYRSDSSLPGIQFSRVLHQHSVCFKLSDYRPNGEVGATPLVLDDRDGPSFKIPEASKKEARAHALAEEAVKRARDLKRKERATTSKPWMVGNRSGSRSWLMRTDSKWRFIRWGSLCLVKFERLLQEVGVDLRIRL